MGRFWQTKKSIEHLNRSQLEALIEENKEAKGQAEYHYKGHKRKTEKGISLHSMYNTINEIFSNDIELHATHEIWMGMSSKPHHYIDIYYPHISPTEIKPSVKIHYTIKDD